jgi:hypothetical protein
MARPRLVLTGVSAEGSPPEESRQAERRRAMTGARVDLMELLGRAD